MEDLYGKVCKDCIYRKYDTIYNGVLLSGNESPNCAKRLRKPSSVWEYGEDCPFYRKQEEGESLIWDSPEKGDKWFLEFLKED